MPTENAINNSWMILNEFNQKDPSYHPPIIKKKKVIKGRSSKPKKYSAEEIFLYKLKKLVTLGLDI